MVNILNFTILGGLELFQLLLEYAKLCNYFWGMSVLAGMF